MNNVVAKPFNTINRRFKAGDPISASEIESDNAVSFDALCERGFVKSANDDASGRPIASVSLTKVD